MEITFILLALVVGIILFFTILFSIKKAVDEVLPYSKRYITIKFNFEEASIDKK